jgi:hypothetical protein
VTGISADPPSRRRNLIEEDFMSTTALRSGTAGHGVAGGADTKGRIGPGLAGYWLSAALAVAALATGATTFLAKDSILGPAAAVGCARGTALVIAVVVTPLMVGAMLMAARGSLRAVVVWLGAAGYLLYNAVVLLFATPYNRFFLLYVAMFSLALWSIGTVLVQTDVARLTQQVTGRLPARGIAIYAWIVVALNAMIWLRGIAPTLTANDPGSFLVASGVTTQPIYIQDLAVWLPLMAVSAFWLWRGRDWGYLMTSALLIVWMLEAFGIGTDQWFGSQADPSSVLASAAMTPAFLAWAAVGAIPVVLALRPLRRERSLTAPTMEGI